MHEYLPHLSDIAGIVERNPIKASLTAIVAINVALAAAGVLRFGRREETKEEKPETERPAPLFVTGVGLQHRARGGRVLVSGGREMRIRRGSRRR